ncbi:unnamed protein product [Chilo suppressalis]|uniref:Large ribosomal subunit protein mL64 n=1 Tax=Chilo suppressalis TaxID=168631 RepID=A0ABN8AVG6_CHISP|nr:hypothetical protein evm_003055 [Chilo suppressalis]CAH0396990.1 unnamed protein product [Chilo suppressalis]
MSLYLRSRLLWPNIINNFTCRYSTTAPDVIDQNDQVLVDDSDETLAREAEIQKKRNVSRLSNAHFNLINGRRPYETPKHLSHLTVKYNRKLYGKYGSESGVNPSLCWPTKQNIQETLEYESIAFPYTIREAMDAAAQKRLEEKNKIEQREIEIATKFAKLAQWKKELNDKIAKKAAEVELAKNKKERLVEEVRRHFGFTLDPRDERFQEMLAKREKEQKKLEKLAKREAKEKMMIAKLQQKNVEMK